MTFTKRLVVDIEFVFIVKVRGTRMLRCSSPPLLLLDVFNEGHCECVNVSIV